MSTSHLPYNSRQDRRARPYTSRPQNSPNSTRSFRKKCWTEEYEPEYKFNGFCTYSSVDRTHRIGSVASYAVPAALTIANSTSGVIRPAYSSSSALSTLGRAVPSFYPEVSAYTRMRGRGRATAACTARKGA